MCFPTNVESLSRARLEYEIEETEQALERERERGRTEWNSDWVKEAIEFLEVAREQLLRLIPPERKREKIVIAGIGVFDPEVLARL